MKYLLESHHTKEECLRGLDEILAKGRKNLDQFYWGCAAGDHTGYAIVDANNVAEVQRLVPEFLRDKAKIIEIKQFSPEQIKSFHQAA